MRKTKKQKIKTELRKKTLTTINPPIQDHLPGSLLTQNEIAAIAQNRKVLPPTKPNIKHYSDHVVIKADLKKLLLLITAIIAAQLIIRLTLF